MRKKQILLTALFCVYTFVYMMTLIFLDGSLWSLQNTGRGVALHYLRMPLLGMGFLTFFAGRRLRGEISARKVRFLLLYGIYAVSILLILWLKDPTASFLISLITLISLGTLGGAVHYYLSAGLAGHSVCGRLAGIGGAVAFLLQMAVQTFFADRLLFVLAILAGFILAIYLTASGPFLWMFEEPLEYASARDDAALPGTRAIALGVTFMLFIYLILGVTDASLASLTFSGDMTSYSWPRLGGAAGYLLGGFLADIGRRRYLQLTTLCAILFAIPVPLLIEAGHGALAIFLFYVVNSVLIIYYTIWFWELAVKTKTPELWAGMGRTIGCFAGTAILCFTGISVPSGLMLEVVFAAGALLTAAFAGFFPQTETRGVPVTQEDRERLFIERFGLTPREKDVLKELLQNDGNMQVIADSLGISQRAAYRHLNNIYEKTGVDSRLSLIRLFYNSDGQADETPHIRLT